MQSNTRRVYYKDFALALLGYFLFVCQDSVSKDLINRYHATQIVLFASISALAIVVITPMEKCMARNKKSKLCSSFF